MMQGQRKLTLNNFYEESIEKAKQYLKSRYSFGICHEDDEDYPESISSQSWITWKIKVKNDLYPLTLIIAIPETFPDKLPKIYLSRKNFLDIAPIPHVDKNRFVCTRDPNVGFINEDKVGEALVEFVRIATEEIINKGIKKVNIGDFVGEFLAYWHEECEFKSLSLYTPTDDIEKLKVITFLKTFLNSKTIIAKTKEEAEKWLAPFKIKIDERQIGEALYLPLPKPIPIPPLPQKNKDIYEIVKDSGQEYVDAIQRYFAKGPSNLVILFSFPLNGDRVLAGWKHSQWRKEVFKGGYIGREYNLSLSLRLNRSGEDAIHKISVERVDKERLFKRSGQGIQPSIKNASITIIGCGSLGSPLAVSLSKCGISKFLLVDNERVESENVARHVCGFLEAGSNIPKSEAIKDRLVKHFPYIDCNAQCEDILTLLQKEDFSVNAYDLIVVATGNLAVERRLSYLLRKGTITPPLLYLWMEPFGVAGQILYIHPNKGACYQCCFENRSENGREEYIFLYSVAKHNKAFYKRECGCQSTFIPYSNLEIDHLISVASKKIMSFLGNKPECSLLYTWLGDLSFFESLGYQIRDEWLANSSYTVHKKIISKNEHCSICKEF